MEDSPENRVPSEPVTRKVLEDYLKIQDLVKLTPEEERFCSLLVRFQLNPSHREVQLIVDDEKGPRRTVALTGYDVVLKKADTPRPSDVRHPQPAAPRTAFAELNDYLTANGEAFTKKHLKWIQEQIEKTPTQEKARAMLGYARKVVFQGGDELSTDHSSRPPAPRAGRRSAPVEEPTF